MAKKRGGYRPGSGRKSNAQIEAVRALLSRVVTEENWGNMIKSVVEDAELGNLRSVTFLLALRYGVTPSSAVNSADDMLDTEPGTSVN